MRIFTALSLILVIPLWAGLAWSGERGDGQITLYVYHLGEQNQIRYRKGDKILPEGVKEIERMFRSRDSDQTRRIDPRLIELLDQIEDHFGVRQVEIISGFRSQDFNRHLKATGHQVARESYHVKGMAADIHLDEVTEEALRDYAQSIQKGGVGFYAPLHMVHVDLGPVRTWGEPGARKPWVGEKNKEVPLKITVSPDRSLKKQLEKIVIEPLGPPVALEKEMELEFFDRNEWKGVGVVRALPFSGCSQSITQRLDDSLTLTTQATKDLAFGKYRFKAKVCGKTGVFQFSNEFYFKKL